MENDQKDKGKWGGSIPCRTDSSRNGTGGTGDRPSQQGRRIYRGKRRISRSRRPDDRQRLFWTSAGK